MSKLIRTVYEPSLPESTPIKNHAESFSLNQNLSAFLCLRVSRPSSPKHFPGLTEVGSDQYFMQASPREMPKYLCRALRIPCHSISARFKRFLSNRRRKDEATCDKLFAAQDIHLVMRDDVGGVDEYRYTGVIQARSSKVILAPPSSP